MATKILFNGNRIIFDGHSDIAEDCMFVTALCDALHASESFNTVKYESGYAEFEQVSGGEGDKFNSDYCTCGGDTSLIEWATNNRRIMFRGHSHDAEDYRLIAAICDALNASKDFCTERYERGYAQFAQVSGGESMMFAIKQCHCDLTPYLKISDLDAQAAELGYLKDAGLVTAIGTNSAAIVNALNSALIDKGYAPNVLEYKLSLTASEVAEKLSQI